MAAVEREVAEEEEREDRTTMMMAEGTMGTMVRCSCRR